MVQVKAKSAVKKQNPRAPSITLEDALIKVQKVYNKEQKHAAPLDIVAKDMGYSTHASGTALQTLASLKYYDLVNRPKEGFLSVNQDVETYIFAPDQNIKKQLLIKWLRAPAVFAEILDKYPSSIPSEGVIRFDFIQMGFSPKGAEDVLTIFLKSVEFVGYYKTPLQELAIESIEPLASDMREESFNFVQTSSNLPVNNSGSEQSNFDRIPIRLSSGRRAWLEIPTPFYEADKNRIKSHIDLIFTEEDELSEDKS